MAIFSGIVSTLVLSLKGDSFLTAAVFACNVEFKGEDYASIRRVGLCRLGAEYADRKIEDELRKSGRKVLPRTRQEVLFSQAEIHCKNEYSQQGERFACSEGVRNFLKIYQTRRMPAAFSSSPPSETQQTEAEISRPQRPVDDSEYL